MPMRIRTRQASGASFDALYAREEDGFTMLADTLDSHLSNGHRIKREDKRYLVTDGQGEFVKEIVLVWFVS
jgi:hypothetical protein